jgi:hypothetical protein
MRRKISRKGAKAQRQSTPGKLSRIYPVPSCLCAFAPLREIFLLLVLIALFSSACHRNEKQLGVPPGVQATIDAVTADIAAEQDEKIYREAAEEWRQAATLDETKEFFKTLRTRLGSVKGRAFHSARGEQKSGVQSYIVQYQTTFERAEGMETFTLVERDGRWLLARYFVNSNALK